MYRYFNKFDNLSYKWLTTWNKIESLRSLRPDSTWEMTFDIYIFHPKSIKKHPSPFFFLLHKNNPFKPEIAFKSTENSLHHQIHWKLFASSNLLRALCIICIGVCNPFVTQGISKKSVRLVDMGRFVGQKVEPIRTI